MLNTQYSSLWAYRSIGRGNYNAMQWTVRKKFSHGVTFDFNYTWSKCMDMTSGGQSDFNNRDGIIYDAYSANQNYAVCDYDVRQAFTGSGLSVALRKRSAFRTACGKGSRCVDRRLAVGRPLDGYHRITFKRSEFGKLDHGLERLGVRHEIGPLPPSTNTTNAADINGKSGPKIRNPPSRAPHTPFHIPEI